VTTDVSQVLDPAAALDPSMSVDLSALLGGFGANLAPDLSSLF
jgi:hypothetical protein